MTAVSLKNISKKFGSFTALEPMSLDIENGEFITLLGPSGCGKTTTLRMIAGLLDPSGGEIAIKGKRVNETPIHKRNLGIVFQNYALFPHKTIAENVGFGLKYRNVTKAEADERVARALDLVQLPHVADRHPRALSGGQQQRIALARAIVIEPDVLLLDEPLSALDANLREDMRVELKRIQDRIGVTSIFVTHDQAEALAMSDRIVVMSAGRVEQVGAPEEVYTRPATEFVAGFLGTSNIIEATASAPSGDHIPLNIPGFGDMDLPRARAPYLAGSGPARVVIRAEALQLREADSSAEPGSLAVPATVEAVDYQGQAARYFLRCGSHQLQAFNMISGTPFHNGAEVKLHLRPEECTALPQA